jgi:hypothetical protein
MLTRLLDATGAELLSSQCDFRIIALGLPEICLEKTCHLFYWYNTRNTGSYCPNVSFLPRVLFFLDRAHTYYIAMEHDASIDLTW